MLEIIRARVTGGWRSLPIPLVPGQSSFGTRPPFLRQSTVDSSSSSRDIDGSPSWSPPVKYKPSAFGKFCYFQMYLTIFINFQCRFI